MTGKRFQYIRGKYSHGVHDTVKDGKYKKGYRTTYDEFDLDKLTDELNIRENKIKQLEKENEQLKSQLADEFNQSNCITVQKSAIDDLNALLKAYKQSNEDYKLQIKKAHEEGLTIEELTYNCGIDL